MLIFHDINFKFSRRNTEIMSSWVFIPTPTTEGRQCNKHMQIDNTTHTHTTNKGHFQIKLVI
jgi:hypothetical protein